MKRQSFIILSLIIINSIVFFPVHNYDFVFYDDGINIYENPYLNPPTFKSTLEFWQRPYKGLYIPLTYTVWAMIARVSQFFKTETHKAELEPHIFHSANFFIHILNVLIVFIILRLIVVRLFMDNKDDSIDSIKLVRIDWAACAGAALFALHPVQVEPVSWATGMKDLLCALFSFAALWQYIAYSIDRAKSINTDNERNRLLYNKRKRAHYVLSSIAFILALLAKPTPVVLPFAVLILETMLFRRGIMECIYSLSIWIVIAIPLVILTKYVQPDMNIKVVAFWPRPFIAGDAVAFYLYKLFLPISLGTDYGRSPGFIMKHDWFYITWLVPFIFLFFIWLSRERRVYLASFGIFIVCLLPVLGLIPFEFQNISTVADRYLYPSMLGPSLAIAWFVANSRGRGAPAVCMLILSLHGIISASQTLNWRNTTALFKHSLEVNPDSSVVNNNMANILVKQGKIDEAIEHYNKNLKNNPEDAGAHYNLGNVLVKQGDIKEAIRHYKMALEIKPYFVKAHYDLGIAFSQQGNIKDAILHYKKAVRLKPDYIEAYNNLGVALSSQGQYEEAISYYEKALHFAPNYAMTHYNIASALESIGRFNDAIFHFRKVFQITPDNADAYLRVADILAQQEKYEEAIGYYKRTLKINPDYNEAHNNMANVFIMQGDISEAILHYSEAVRINPKNAEAHYNLGYALSRQGREEEAAIHYSEAFRLSPELRTR